MNEPNRLVASWLREVDSGWAIDADAELRRFHASSELVRGQERIPARWYRAWIALAGVVLVSLGIAAVLSNRTVPQETGPRASQANGVQPGPGFGPGDGQVAAHPGSSLAAIDGAGGTDIWAVGETHGDGGNDHSLVVHWDGASWTTTTVPDVGRLIAVDATSPDDAWALGYGGLLHWNGAEWTTEPLPRGNYGALSALGPSDVWLAGTRTGPLIGANSRGLSSAVAHFDGSTWTVMQPPNPGTRDNYLTGIVALSSTDVWVGGYSVDLAQGSGEGSTLTMHWDGRAWDVVAAPDPSRSLNIIWGMGADGTGAVWALGDYRASDHHLHALMRRWSGRTWEMVEVNGLSLWSAQAVGGTASGPAWVVGSPATSSLAVASCTEATCDLIVPPTDFDVTASSIFVAAADDAWIVGVEWGRHSMPLVEHWDGATWARVVVPNTIE